MIKIPNQKITYHDHETFLNPTVVCPKCGKLAGLQNGQMDGATGLGWFDPYNKGKYVHKGCLSVKRLVEIADTSFPIAVTT
jgi:hypothetical protein